MISRWFFTQIDNSSLLIFRVLFGFLISAEAIGAIFTGWITETLVEPLFTFNFLGFDFLQPLSGNGMYYYYLIMGIFGLLVMIGYKYRWSLIMYTIMWAGVYFMQKASYNNHYYLLMILCLIMSVLPASNNFSIDSKITPSIKRISMPRWCVLIIITQLWIVYTYAAIAKLYPDWLDYTVAKNLMLPKANYPVIGALLQKHTSHIIIAYFGIFFDLLIVPLLLWRKTRLIAFIFSAFFHLFNSIIFGIGIFPYLSLAFSLFFFSKERIHRLFMRKKEFYAASEVLIPSYKKIIVSIIITWFITQITLPVRHWFIPGDVLWTEEGHRLSWRMMLRGKSGVTHFYITDKSDPNSERKLINKNLYLTNKQIPLVSTKPDAMWQFAQFLKKTYAKNGKNIAVFVSSKVSVNGKELKEFINPEVDLANVCWNYFTSNPWIIKYNE